MNLDIDYTKWYIDESFLAIINNFITLCNSNNFYDIATINTCKLPDRTILYALNRYYDTNKIIELISHTLSDTKGLKNLLYHVFEYIYSERDDMKNDKWIKQIYTVIDKQSHYNLISYTGFKLYIEMHVNTINKLNVFMSKDILYF